MQSIKSMSHIHPSLIGLVCAGLLSATAAWGQSSDTPTCTTGISVEELTDGLDVYGPAEGEGAIGETEDLVVGGDGRVRSLVAEIGGVLGLRESTVYVPWEDVEVGETWVRVPIEDPDSTLFGVFSDDALVEEMDVRAKGIEIGSLDAPPRAFRAGEMIGDFARSRQDDDLFDFGVVSDLLIQDDQVAAVVIEPDLGLGFAQEVVVDFSNYTEGNWDPGASSVEFDSEETRDIGAFEC